MKKLAVSVVPHMISAAVLALAACAISPMSEYDSMAESVVKVSHDNDLCAGVIYDADAGRIVTNRHCVEGAIESIKVTLRDGTELTAMLVGESNDIDIAVLRVAPSSRLRAATFGGTVKVGDTVFAIGHPVGFSWSLTKGIVSYVGRSSASALGTFLQTDAAINPGNSGGALYDARREIVGINTARATRGSNIGFAIPIGEAMSAVRLIEARA